MSKPVNRGPKDGESKAWMGVLAFFVVLALLGPTLLFRAAFDPDRGKRQEQAANEAHQTKGIVESIDLRERRVTIAHDAIPGVMPAMTMPFTAQDEKMLSGLARGDSVEFTFRIRDRAAWIEKIEKTAPAAADRK